MIKSAVEEVHAAQVRSVADLLVGAGRQDPRVILNVRLGGDIAALTGICRQQAQLVEAGARVAALEAQLEKARARVATLEG